jgi:putative ABC transport system substrate-binding protein
LQWLQRFLPQKKIVGVLFNPKENGDKIETATKLASDLGLRLIARAVETPQDLPDALENLARQIDVLWGIADQTVLSPQTAEAILLTAFRHRIPFVGLSMSWVKAGALYALDRDYLDLGAQCGEMALQLLQGAQASALPPIAPRKVVYSLNLKTASYMKVDIPEALIKGAQQVFP